MIIKKILFTTDFSANAANALNFAVKIAKKTGAQLSILYAFHPHLTQENVPPYIYEDVVKKDEIECLRKLEKLKRSIATEINAITIFRQGFAEDVIKEVADENKIDLIVMGTKGASGVSGVIFGSITSSVLSDSTCPVLAIQPDAKYSSFKHIAFTTELNNEDLPIIKQLSQFAKLFDAELSVLHINKLDFDSLEVQLNEFESKLKNMSAGDKVNFRFVKYDNVMDGIDFFIKENNVDLLSMITHKRNLFERIYHGSLTKKISHKAFIPLLSFSL